MNEHVKPDSATAKRAARTAARHPQRRRHPRGAAAEEARRRCRASPSPMRENLLVRIEAADGTVGWGEAASAPTMTGDTQGGLVAAVRHLAPLLVGQDAWARPQLVARLHAALMGNTGAHSAIEMALLDLAGRAAGVPLAALIGGAVRDTRCAHVAARQFDRREGRRRGARQDGRGLPLLQAQGGDQAAGAGHRRHARRARRAGAGRAPLRRRQLRVRARGGAALRRGHARGRAPVPRAAARSPPISPAWRRSRSCRPCPSAPTRASIRWPTSRRMRAAARAGFRSS